MAECVVVDVIDVTTKSTMRVPVQYVRPTAVTPMLVPIALNAEGLALNAPSETTETDSKAEKSVFTLCELYQRGKCDRKDKCRHVHVEPEFLREQRQKHLVWMEDNAHVFERMPPNQVFEVFNATIKEVMQVPRVQLEYTRGLFLSPEDRDKKVPPSTSVNSYCGKVPTACLLHLNGACKWGEHCNQAHISREWLQARNHDFELWMEARRADFTQLPPSQLLRVYHPNLYEVVQISKESIIQFTRGLFQAGDKVPSVCLLFQKNRCSCGELCKQIHANLEHMTFHRLPPSEGTAGGVAARRH
eukprot:RCo035723